MIHPALTIARQRQKTKAGTALSPEQRATRNALIDRLYEREGQTLKQIGELLCISGERVRQLRKARHRKGRPRKRAALVRG